MKWTKIVSGSSWAEIKPSLAVTTQQVWLRLPKYTFPLVTYIHNVNWQSLCYSIMEYHFLRIYASTPQNITFSEVSLATYILWQLRWVNQANNWVGWEILWQTAGGYWLMTGAPRTLQFTQAVTVYCIQCSATAAHSVKTRPSSRHHSSFLDISIWFVWFVNRGTAMLSINSLCPSPSVLINMYEWLKFAF